MNLLGDPVIGEDHALGDSLVDLQRLFGNQVVDLRFPVCLVFAQLNPNLDPFQLQSTTCGK